MVETLRPNPGFSGRTIERALAALLLVSLATYAVGALVERSLPTVHDVGVVGVHLAAAIAIVLPLAVVVHGLVGATSQFAIAPRLVEFATAAATLVGVTLVFWIELQPSDPMPTALRALTIVATAGVLLLAGLYVVDYGRRFGAVADREAD